MAAAAQHRNDAARKAWLQGLKDGDEVAWVGSGQTQIITVRRGHAAFYWTSGTQHNNRVTHSFTFATGKGVKTDYSDSADGWLWPVTDEHRQAVRAHEARHALRTAHWSSADFTDDQILAAAAALWPNGVPK